MPVTTASPSLAQVELDVDVAVDGVAALAVADASGDEDADVSTRARAHESFVLPPSLPIVRDSCPTYGRTVLVGCPQWPRVSTT